MPSATSYQDVEFAKDKHIKYWLRCLRTPLPDGYTSTDSSRMSLAFFTLAALDLLDVLHSSVSSADRQGYIDWIYSCQLPTGGFRGSPLHDLGDESRPENSCWDPATVTMTYFALSALLILGDDFARVNRDGCLWWLRDLQLPNGSFGDLLGENDEPQGGDDPRQCRCAAAIRYILRHPVDSTDVPDIDIDKLVSYIAACQTYDGGFAENPYYESHAGYTYCSIGVLSFLDRVPSSPRQQVLSTADWSISFREAVKWLVSRQTARIDEEKDDETSPSNVVLPPFQGMEPVGRKSLLPRLTITADDIEFSGFNGRVNKVADTCYCFWVTGALSMLRSSELIDKGGLRRYLLGKTQHVVGGFCRGPEQPPDILHAYLGLAALSIIGQGEIQRFDPVLCISSRALDFMKTLPWWRGEKKTVTIPLRPKPTSSTPS